MPQPIRPFAIMRLTHDALRVGMTELERALDQLETEGPAPLRGALEPLRATLDLHRRQEDERFFPVLDRIAEGVITAEALQAEHDDDVEDMSAIDEVLADWSPARAEELAALVRAWIADMQAHLEHEETIMMPLVGKTADTPQGRVAVVRDIVEVDLDAFLSVQIPYVVRQLGGSDFAPKLPMFLRALTVVLTEEELAIAGVEVEPGEEGPTVSCSWDPRRVA